MKKTFLFVLMTFVYCSVLLSQTKFEKGYFIDNNNLRIECLIKNKDWLNNPTKFNYKISENETVQSAQIDAVKEFGLYGISKFIRADANVDLTSDNNIEQLSNSKEPDFVAKQLFLKILIDGEASLYSYETKGVRRFFYSTKNDTIQQLIYKNYIDANGQIAANTDFRAQLWYHVKCSNTNLSAIQNIDYKESSLEDYFRNYNECVGNKFVEYNKKKNSFTFGISAGVDYTSLNLSNSEASMNNTKFNNKTSFVAGINIEYILPFDNNKWSILFEPNYHSYKNSTVYSGADAGSATVNYQAIDFPLGARYYCFLNKDSKLFIDALAILPFNVKLKSDLRLGRLLALNIKTQSTAAFGIGYNYKRLSAEVRYYLNQEIISNYVYWSSKFGRSSFLLSYRIF